jgi:putative CRISPR-associated protein (TIGR02619 family)
MSKLVVTVGTSLFTSASWREEGRFGMIRGYDSWIEKYKGKPGARAASGKYVPEKIEARLGQRNASDFAEFEWEPQCPLRYSAEITSLLRWAENGRAADLSAFLKENYQGVDLVCTSGSKDPSRIAADYLCGVLEQRLGVQGVRVADELVGQSLLDRVEHFQTYLRSLPVDETVDLVVTGGFKAFAMFGAVFAATAERKQWKVLYLHEEKYDNLIVQSFKDSDLRLEDRSREFRIGPSAPVRHGR